MKPTLFLTSPRTKTSPSRRRQLVAAFERSGLPAAAFARQHGIVYTTFCSWRRRRPAMPKVGFAEVELVRPPSPEPMVVEWGSRARMRLSSHAQLELAVSLLKSLEGAC
jgi:transposase-like protein